MKIFIKQPFRVVLHKNALFTMESFQIMIEVVVKCSLKLYFWLPCKVCNYSGNLRLQEGLKQNLNKQLFSFSKETN